MEVGLVRCVWKCDIVKSYICTVEKKALVSVIIPFYNPPPHFMRQAIESVLRQTYQTLELLLIDDGSETESVAVAAEYAEKFPAQVSIYHHPGRQNRGISASRQLGIHQARGRFIAFLDADDIWLPNKLEEQVALLEEHPEVAMVYGNTLYWYSWTGKASDLQRDYLPKIGKRLDGVVQPPNLLLLYLSGKTIVPCPSSLLVRRQALEVIGGFEDAFPGMYEDQVFYAKISLEAPIYVSERCWDQYRQHPESISALAVSSGEKQSTRLEYLEWLEKYLTKKEGLDPEIWQALRRGLWFSREPNFLFPSEPWRKVVWRLKKWLLKIEEWFLPVPLRRKIWLRGLKTE
ncbi:MAG TPA: glycosyltransferase family A protein [Anaerolineales bacterium]|nr:glycosyltransferase family A protein [Anaerolineales bacterium]